MRIAKKADVVRHRRCGLKLLDIVLRSMTIDDVIKDTISIHTQFPDIWGAGWANVHWAMMNAVLEDLKKITGFSNGNTMICFNLDEALTDEQIDYIAKQCNITEPFEKSFPRE